MRTKRVFVLLALAIALVSLASVISAGAAPAELQSPDMVAMEGDTSEAVAFDVSPALRDLSAPRVAGPASGQMVEFQPDWGPFPEDNGYSGDGALQGSGLFGREAEPLIPAPMANFEGLGNADNLAVYGFRGLPPDPVGDVGPNHYVEMINAVFGVYDKSGNMLLGPLPLGALWQGFAIPDCMDPSGDPIVLYDQLADRWILTQFTSRFASGVFYNCVAVSQTGDPTGAYYRYAFTSGEFFPDYPKYGVWRDTYVITTREFAADGRSGVGVYGLERKRMIQGRPNVRVVSFFLDNATIPPYLIGDGLLPADMDGKRKPENKAAIPLVGTMDDDFPYGAPFDGLNIFDLNVKWRSTPIATLELAAQLPVAEFDSVYPCGPNPRACLPQPGVAPEQYLDILSYRQRPLWRLAYRNFKDYESMVTNQSVEAMPGMAGVRWYEIRRQQGEYSLFQEGTYAPNDGVHRWMGSIAQDKRGNMALGYSVVNGVDVYPGIRYTGRMAGDTAGQMTLGEGVIIDGTGSQLSIYNRWGDYTSMNVDPVDDCTFWYVNQYYEISEEMAFQTRIASFKLPGCK